MTVQSSSGSPSQRSKRFHVDVLQLDPRRGAGIDVASAPSLPLPEVAGETIATMCSLLAETIRQVRVPSSWWRDGARGVGWGGSRCWREWCGRVEDGGVG